MQTLCTVEEDPDGERIEDQLVVLRDQLLQLSPTEQQLSSAPADRLPVPVDSRPAVPPATSASIQATLQVITLFTRVPHVLTNEFVWTSNGRASSTRRSPSTRDC